MEDRINYYILLPAIFLLFFVQTTFIAQIFWGFSAPNLVFIFLLSAALLSCTSDFFYIILLFGFLFDVLSGKNFGVYMLSFSFACVAACYLKLKFLKEKNYFIRVAAVSVLATLVYNIIYFALSFFVFSTEFSFSGFAAKKILFDLIYASVLTYPIMYLISKKEQ